MSAIIRFMNYEQLLRERDLKVTPQRLGILTLMHQSGHISIEDLYEKISRQFSSISLATLYKNVHAMIETALVKEVKIPSMKSKYELIKAPHAHLLCTQCGSFEDVSVPMEQIEAMLPHGVHFKTTESSLVFSGICETCQKG